MLIETTSIDYLAFQCVLIYITFKLWSLNKYIHNSFLSTKATLLKFMFVRKKDSFSDVIFINYFYFFIPIFDYLFILNQTSYPHLILINYLNGIKLSMVNCISCSWWWWSHEIRLYKFYIMYYRGNIWIYSFQKNQDIK